MLACRPTASRASSRRCGRVSGLGPRRPVARAPRGSGSWPSGAGAAGGGRAACRPTAGRLLQHGPPPRQALRRPQPTSWAPPAFGRQCRSQHAGPTSSRRPGGNSARPWALGSWPPAHSGRQGARRHRRSRRCRCSSASLRAQRPHCPPWPRGWRHGWRAKSRPRPGCGPPSCVRRRRPSWLRLRACCRQPRRRTRSLGAVASSGHFQASEEVEAADKMDGVFLAHREGGAGR
mmetsp:Transcript_66781/g.215230  ORF Transcript_66781/g.215230 Transcript_66781/m.215230 type:complete len:233 (+) Transcript_66781:1191-1889(+)